MLEVVGSASSQSNLEVSSLPSGLSGLEPAAENGHWSAAGVNSLRGCNPDRSIQAAYKLSFTNASPPVKLTLESSGGFGKKLLRNISPDHTKYTSPHAFWASKTGGVLRMPDFSLDRIWQTFSFSTYVCILDVIIVYGKVRYSETEPCCSNGISGGAFLEL